MRRANVGWLGFIVFITALATAWPANAFGQAQGNQANTALKPEALAGTYQGTATSPSGDMTVSVTLKYEKGAFSGTIEHPEGPAIPITGGTLTEDRLVLTIDMGGAPGTITCTVKDPARVEGTWSMADASGTVALTRAAADGAKPAADKPAAAAPAAGATGEKPAAAGADPISGQWDGVTGNSDMSVPFTMRLKLDGEKVSGDISSDQGSAPLSVGTWKNGALNLSFELSSAGTITMVGSIQEGKLVGSLDVGGQMQMQWAAVKKGS